jgi:integrase
VAETVHPDNAARWKAWLSHLGAHRKPGATDSDWRLRMGSTQHLITALGNVPLTQMNFHVLCERLLRAVKRSADEPNARLSFERMRKVMDHSREFLAWSMRQTPDAFKHMTQADLERMRIQRVHYEQLLARDGSPPAPVRERAHYSREVLLMLASANLDYDVRLSRARACACLQYLAGMRVTAAATLSFACIDLDRLVVHQLPALGVRTKGGAAGITPLMADDAVLAPVRRWHAFANAHVPPNAPFFAVLTRAKPPQFLPVSNRDVGARRGLALDDDYAALFKHLGLAYHGSHAFRRSHILHMVQRCRDMNDFLAVSETVLHSNVRTTQGYAGLSVEKRRDIYHGLVARESKLNADCADNADRDAGELTLAQCRALLRDRQLSPPARRMLAELITEIVSASVSA